MPSHFRGPEGVDRLNHSAALTFDINALWFYVHVFQYACQTSVPVPQATLRRHGAKCVMLIASVGPASNHIVRHASESR